MCQQVYVYIYIYILLLCCVVLAHRHDSLRQLNGTEPYVMLLVHLCSSLYDKSEYLLLKWPFIHSDENTFTTNTTRTLPIAMTDAKLKLKLFPKTTRTQKSSENHWCACLTNARWQRCSLIQQLAEGYSSVVSWLSCYWAVNSADGSCLWVLIRSVTLNLGIDTWGDAEQGKTAIYRPSIMTFIDDVTTGAWGFETRTQRHTHTRIHSSSRDWIHLFELCAPKHTPAYPFYPK